MPRRTLEARIYEAYERLTPAERRLAHVLLENQQDLPAFTAGELATKASVSKSTAGRLIRALGYETFPQAKRAVREQQFWGSPQLVTDRSPDESVSPELVLEADLTNVRLTFEAIPKGLLDRIAQRIVKARQLWIIGLRSGYGLAHHAAHYFTLIRNEVHVISAQGGSYSHDVASIEPGDLLLTIAFRRRPQFLPGLFDHVRKAGAHTVLITDLSAAASAKAADDVLRCRCQSPSPFNSFVAAVTIVNYLAWKASELSGAEAIDRFRRIDDLVLLLDRVSTPANRRS